MAEKFMAAIGQGFVQTAIMSETNSNKYKLSIAANMLASTPGAGHILLNDVAVGTQTNGRGLNVRLFNTLTRQVEEFKTFEFREDDSYSGNTAFMVYMNSLVFKENVLAIFTSGQGLLTSPSISTWMREHGSKNWPAPWNTKTFNISFSALYDIKRGLIITESARSNAGIDYGDTRAKFETVYDIFTDIGSTGYTKKPVEDGVAYSNQTTDYVYKVYESTLAAAGLKVEDKIYLTTQLKNNIRMLQRGSSTKVDAVFYNDVGDRNVVATSLNVGQPNNWITHERYFVVPADAVRFEIVISTTPGNGTNEQQANDSYCRNTVMSIVSRLEKVDLVSASISVNGIRMNKGADNTGPTIPELRLPDTAKFPNATITSKEFREKQ